MDSPNSASVSPDHPSSPLLFANPSSAEVSPQPSPPLFTPLSMASALQQTPAQDDTPLNQLPIATPLHSPTTYFEARFPRTSSPKPIITVTDAEQLPASPNIAPIDGSPLVKPQRVQMVRSVSRTKSRSGSGVTTPTTVAGEEDPALWMVYNEYGELVTIEQMAKPIVAEELTVTRALRLVYKTYHAEFKDQMREVLSPLLEGRITALVESDDSESTGKKYLNDNLSSWIFAPSPDRQGTPEEEIPHTVPVYEGPPRILDIGCADGRWCEKIKKEYPDWIVEGVDDIDRWSNSWEGSPPRDFMEPLPNANEKVYFCNVHLSQTRPEFTCRDINQLLSHETPIPQNLYSLIRGRDVFDRVESYKNFLEDCRHLLQPSGVVEFVEIDPRPRCNYIVDRRHSNSERRSGAETNWTDKIADRFKNPYDAQLATNVPGWTARVEERLKAAIRPRDGVPAAKIKGWLQGAGFWDVKQVVIRLPVGGNTSSGQKLANLMIQELEIENSIPILAAKLPKIEIEDISNGNFFLNLHVVTARKPKFPRPGDLLLDGTRQEMTDFKYEKMAQRTSATKNSNLREIEKGGGWKRFGVDLQSNHMVANMVASLTTLKGGPEQGGSPPAPVMVRESIL